MGSTLVHKGATDDTSILACSHDAGEKTNDEMLSFYYQNVRSIKCKTNDFYVSVSACDYNIIALSETWLDEAVYDSEIFPADFTVYR